MTIVSDNCLASWPQLPAADAASPQLPAELRRGHRQATQDRGFKLHSMERLQESPEDMGEDSENVKWEEI